MEVSHGVGGKWTCAAPMLPHDVKGRALDVPDGEGSRLSMRIGRGRGVIVVVFRREVDGMDVEA